MTKKESSLSKLDECWNAIEAEYAFVKLVDEKGSFDISASQIKKYREPRLVTKFDHRGNLPTIFKENNLSILPTSRGSYRISRFNTFQEVKAEFTNKVKYFPIPPFIESIKPEEISSEGIALNAAYSSGIIADFLGEEELVPTISGRQGSGDFDFYIRGIKGSGDHPVSVSGSQIEIDAGYEGLECLSLIEAKMGLANDFMLRQLYYPYRVWSSRIEKPVRPVFLTFSNSMFYLFEYEFTDPMVYNSAKLRQSARYSIVPIDISRDEITYTYKNTEGHEDDSSVPPIQADSIERVLDLCERLSHGFMTKEQITNAYGFTARQTDYYLNAAKYLGLAKCEPRSNRCELTDSGRKYVNMNEAEGRLFICELMFQHQIFRDMYSMLINSGKFPTKQETAKIIEDNTYLTRGTPFRRAGSYLSWMHWLISLESDED